MSVWKDPWTGQDLIEIRPRKKLADGEYEWEKMYCPLCDDFAGMSWGTHVHCPKCGSPPGRDHEVANYDPMWHDGDVMCTKCQTRVRGYDAG